jgi:hypothetical protein
MEQTTRHATAHRPRGHTSTVEALPCQEDWEPLRELGFTAPFPLLDPGRADQLVRACSNHDPGSLPWSRGWHAIVPEVCEAAAHPAIVTRLQSVLGPDIMLWGAQLVCQRPWGAHRWHLDVESVAVDGLAVWIALKNVTRDACLQLIPGSHRFAVSPQELERGAGLDLRDDAAVLSAAQRLSPGSQIVAMGIGTGQAFVFDPKIWHGSRNRTRKWRFTMILQYARTGNGPRIPLTYTPPQPTWASSAAPCVLISGQDHQGTSFLVEPPTRDRGRTSTWWGGAAYRRVKAVALAATRKATRRFGPLSLEDRLIARRVSQLEASRRRAPIVCSR